MKLKNLASLFVMALVLLPAFLLAQPTPAANVDDHRLDCSVDFRILEIKSDTVFKTNILDGKIGFERKISRLTVEIVTINASEKQKADSKLAFNWLQANAKELDFKTIMLDKEEIKTLKASYKKDKKSIFSYKIQVGVQEENGCLVGYAHLIGKTLGNYLEQK